jgi:hypothetical protein
MHGTVLLEKEELKTAFQKFSHAKTVYEELGKMGLPSTVLYQMRVAEIQISLRYCRYVLSRAGIEVEDVSVQVFEFSFSFYYAFMMPAQNSNVQALLTSRSQSVPKTPGSLQCIRWIGSVVTIPANEKLNAALQITQTLSHKLEAKDVMDTGEKTYHMLSEPGK